MVRFAGREIPKSPFVTSVEGMAGDASKVSASGPGLGKTGGMVGSKAFFEVNTKSMIFFDPLRFNAI